MQAAAVHQVVQTLEQRLADSLASHEEVSRQLQQERESKQELSQQAADKAARLAHMEGTSWSHDSCLKGDGQPVSGMVA